MDQHPKSWLDRLLGAAIVLAVSAWLIHWAWVEVEPLWPVGLGLVVLGAVAFCASRWRQNRYW